jgi:hypothetical protein
MKNALRRRLTPVLTGLALAGGSLAGLAVAGLALAGCSNSASSGPAGAAAARAAPHGAAKAGAGASGQGTSGTSSQARLEASSAIVYTASLTVRAADVRAADAQAKDIVAAMGGYVSAESTSIDPAHPARSTASLQLKVPVAGYPAALNRLASGLGTQVSLQQQAQDVTEDVADTSSRVASDQSAIAQLRGLLGRASSVSDVLTIQGQISQQESDLESLEARQRALSHETAYATVSLSLMTSPPPAKRPGQPRGHPAGFVRGLSGGWHALRAVVSALFTGFGAVLPFIVLIAAAAYLGYRARRVLARRRARAAE